MKSERKLREKNNNDIIMALPGFINKILLFTNSGTVLTRAMNKIADDYSLIKEYENNYFISEYLKLCDACKKSEGNIVESFAIFGKCSGNKELSRVSGILLSSMNSGTAMWELLSEISEKLWEERKRLCLSRIRLAESKMSFPLGIMLISLIIITAAPAMMQMKY